ncbi:transposase [Streptomyces hygroscopicus]|nr:transposase [Streptomyces hygroscopicus]
MDQIALGVLTKVFPPGLVDEVVDATGRREVRRRRLPARVVVYFVLAMCLFRSAGYEEVLRLLSEGLRRDGWDVPCTAAVSRARVRLGPEPLRVLFDRVCRPVATAETAGAWYRQWRLVAIDGTAFEVPDTQANADYFGRAVSDRGAGAFPQVRLVMLAECGTHAVFGAAMGPFTVSEVALAGQLWDRMEPGMLVLADRNFPAFPRWRAARAGGADLLWRVKSNAVLPLCQQLEDGSYLSQIFASADYYQCSDPEHVRVIEYTLEGSTEVYRLITTVLDPDQAPARELAVLYHERWEIESLLDELKVHQAGARSVLRSKTPDGVEQEVHGMLLVHHALRQLAHLAARSRRVDPDRVSFTRTLHAARRQVPAQAGFSPRKTAPDAEPGTR